MSVTLNDLIPAVMILEGARGKTFGGEDVELLGFAEVVDGDLLFVTERLVADVEVYTLKLVEI